MPEPQPNSTSSGSTSESTPVSFHREQDFGKLTLEQLFSEPVSLKFIKTKRVEVYSDDPNDEQPPPEEYEFLNLPFEALFNIPVSLNPQKHEKTQEDDTGPTLGTGLNFLFQQFIESQTEFSDTVTVIVVISNEVNNTVTPIIIFEPPTQTTLPVVFVPVIVIPNINDVDYVNETRLYLSEAESTTGNVLTNDGGVIGLGRIITVNGIANGDGLDLSADPDVLRFNTDYGRFEIDCLTGDYTYDLFDVSGVDDALSNTYETFTYVFQYDSGGTYSAVLTVFIDLNQAPVAVDDAYDTNEDTVLSVATVADGLLGNDTDPDTRYDVVDWQEIIAVNGAGANVGSPFVPAAGGILTVNSNGTFTYDPNGDFAVLNDGETQEVTFTYTVADAEGLYDTATATITVHGLTAVTIEPELTQLCETMDPESGYIVWHDCDVNPLGIEPFLQPPPPLPPPLHPHDIFQPPMLTQQLAITVLPRSMGDELDAFMFLSHETL